MRFDSFFDSLSIKAGVLAILTLGGCIATTYPYMRAETAQRIAAPAWMIKRDIPADPFMLRAYERIHERGGTANVYIEGESYIYVGETEKRKTTTPYNPVALHLASKDKADNVIYLARPCQYTGMLSVAEECDERYGEEASFSEDVMASYNTVLDEISKRYGIHSFNLVGFGGGAAIATLLASERDDVTTLRTVAGILDHETYTTKLEIDPMTESLNPVHEASTLTKMPQYHFIGGRDTMVPPAVLHSYLQSMPPTNCVQTMLIQEAEHAAGWVDKWPELLELPVTCYNSDATMPETTMAPTMPHDLPKTVREKPAKP